jgi:hypothetical protein
MYTYPFQALQNTSTTHSRMLHLIIMCSQWSKKGIRSLLLRIQDLFWIETTQIVTKQIFKKIYIYNTTKLYMKVNCMVHPMIFVPYCECLHFYPIKLVTIKRNEGHLSLHRTPPLSMPLSRTHTNYLSAL